MVTSKSNGKIKKFLLDNEFFGITIIVLATYLLLIRSGLQAVFLYVPSLISLFFMVLFYNLDDYISHSIFESPRFEIHPIGNSRWKARVFGGSTIMGLIVLSILLRDVKANLGSYHFYENVYLNLLLFLFLVGPVGYLVIFLRQCQIVVKDVESDPPISFKVASPYIKIYYFATIGVLFGLLVGHLFLSRSIQKSSQSFASTLTFPIQITEIASVTYQITVNYLFIAILSLGVLAIAFGMYLEWKMVKKLNWENLRASMIQNKVIDADWIASLIKSRAHEL